MPLTRQQAREIDRRAIDDHGIPGIVLMENAGRGVAELFMSLNPDRKPAIIVCGPGNNGGDGFVIARHLHLCGWPVRVVVPRPPTAGDAIIAFQPIVKMNMIANPGIQHDAGWMIDAMYGTGLSRPVTGDDAATIERMNASGLPILAVDIPSGLDCDTGEPLGVCVNATHTATFVDVKQGFENPASRAFTGRVHVIAIGAPS